MNPKDRPVVYHQTNSISSFVAGAVFGALAAVAFSTKEGRQLSQQLFDSLKDFSETVKDTATDKFDSQPPQPPSPTTTYDSGLPHQNSSSVVDRLRRQSPTSSSGFFTQRGKPLKPQS